MEATEAAKQGDDDMSMEEILQSIRKIIAEDDPKKPAEAKTNGQQPMAEPKKQEVPGSDVLELTEMLKEDGTVVSVEAKKEAAKPAGGDVLSAIDKVLSPEAPKQAEPAPAAPVAAPVAAPAAAQPAAPAGEGLLSPEAAAMAAASLKKLQQPEAAPAPLGSPSFRSGLTIEDMVEQMIRPMLKTWLDANLPPIVERIVEREVKKLTK